jgi:nitric oxide reductase NorD protein
VNDGSAPRAGPHLRALSLLAEAISGRPLPLTPTRHHPARAGLCPTRRGSRGEWVLVLPSAADGFRSDTDWRRALRLSVLRASLLEAHRAPAAPSTSWASRDRRPRLERWLEQLLQRAWIDARIRAGFPGARSDLAEVQRLTLTRLGASPRGALRRLLQDLTRASLAPLPFAASDARDTWLQTLCTTAHRVLDADADLALCGTTAAELYDLLQSRFPGSRKTLRSLSVRVRPAALDGPPGQPMVRLAGHAVPAAEETQAAGPTPAPEPATDPPTSGVTLGQARASDRPLHGSVGATQAQAPSVTIDEAASSQDEDASSPTPPDPVTLRSRYGAGAGEAVGVFLIDEWDCHGKQFLPAWCRLHEMRLRGPEQDLLAEVRERHPALARRILERFAALKPVSHRRIRGVPDGEDLDPDGVIAAMIDRRAGSASDERAWVRRERRDRDVATALLLDMSASTSLSLPAPTVSAVVPPLPPNPSGGATQGALLYGFYDDTPMREAEPPRRRVIDVARDSLALMALGLATLGDDHAIYGFSGSGRSQVEFHVARDFDDPWQQRSLGRALAGIEPRGSTRMGPAIRHAAAKLSRRPAPQRLLILVSDGYPQDIDYGPDRNDEGYGLQDTAHALREAQRQGVATFCVTIDPGGHDYLKRMCAPEAYRVIEDVHALPEALSEIYARLTSRM